MLSKKLLGTLAKKIGTKLAGPVGWLVSFAIDYGWKYIEQAAIWLYKKSKLTTKKINRKIDKEKIKRADNAKDLKSAVDDFLD